MTMAAAADEAPPAKKGPSLVVQIVVLLVLSAAAAGGGWFAGGQMRSGQPAGGTETAAEPAPAEEHGSADAHGGEAASGQEEAGHGDAKAAAAGPSVVPLAPITTNLAQPADTWLRLELAVVFEKAPEDPRLAETIQQDLLAFVRTLKLHQIEGASGFQQLRADLDERAAIRSDGLAKHVLIRTMLLE